MSWLPGSGSPRVQQLSSGTFDCGVLRITAKHPRPEVEQILEELQQLLQQLLTRRSSLVEFCLKLSFFSA